MFKKRKYQILEETIHTSNKNKNCMNNYDTRDYYRRLFTKDGPLKKYVKEVNEKQYKQVIDLYGQLILQKIMDGGFHDFPVENAGRIFVYQRKKTKKYLRCSPYSKYMYFIYWNRKSFNNSFYAFSIPTQKTVPFFRENVDQTKSYYIPNNKIAIW